MEALEQVRSWPVPNAAAGVVRHVEVVGTVGDVERRFALKSVTKLVTALAVLVAVEEGTVALDDPAGPPGATLRHLLAHASGLGFDGTEPLARVGAKRIYSNAGIDAAADHLAAAAGMPWLDYVAEAVLGPLGMAGTRFDRPVASWGASAPLVDVLALGRELLDPTLVSGATLAEAASVQFPGLAGVVPGIGRSDPCDWGLGFELRDGKSPHWTGAANSPRTFGHFGGSGTFLWVDPDAGVALAALTDRDFDAWALEAWPALADAVLAEH